MIYIIENLLINKTISLGKLIIFKFLIYIFFEIE